MVFSPGSKDPLLLKRDDDDGRFEKVLSGIKAKEEEERLEKKFRSLRSISERAVEHLYPAGRCPVRSRTFGQASHHGLYPETSGASDPP